MIQHKINQINGIKFELDTMKSIDREVIDKAISLLDEFIGICQNHPDLKEDLEMTDVEIEEQNCREKSMGYFINDWLVVYEEDRCQVLCKIKNGKKHVCHTHWDEDEGVCWYEFYILDIGQKSKEVMWDCYTPKFRKCFPMEEDDYSFLLEEYDDYDDY